MKKTLLKNFAIFIGKQLCWRLFLIKLQAFMPETLLKRDSSTYIFLCILRIFIFFEKHLRTAASDYSFTLVIYLFFGCLSKKNYDFLRLVTHNDILKIYRLFNILEMLSSVTWQKIFLKYIKYHIFTQKNKFCIMKNIKPVWFN